MPWTLLLRPTVILTILLALAVAGNVILFKARDRALKHVGSIEAERDQAIAAGKACSDGVEKVRAQTAARDKAVKAALAGAEARARSAEARAQATLQAPMPVPGDPCASAAALAREKLGARGAR